MATIATKAAEAVGYYGYPNVVPERVSALEAASQTFLKGNFVIGSSGYVAIIASDNDGDALGIATRAGQNATVGTKYAEFVPLVPGLLLEMNLLEASDSAHVLAVTDLWAFPQWQTTSSHHVLNTTSTTDRFFIVKIGLGEVGDSYGPGGVGDTNARVLAVPVGSMMAVSPDV